MSEIDELKALVARMATDAAKREEAAVRKAEERADEAAKRAKDMAAKMAV